jgi:very-short-patch-repair endonuclease
LAAVALAATFSLEVSSTGPLGPWIADFVSYECKIILEADGGQHVDSEHDKARDADLAARGFRVLRFWNNDILTNTNGVLERILEVIETSSSPALASLGHPLPRGEREEE